MEPTGLWCTRHFIWMDASRMKGKRGKKGSFKIRWGSVFAEVVGGGGPVLIISLVVQDSQPTLSGFFLSYLPPIGLAAARMEVRAFRVAWIPERKHTTIETERKLRRHKILFSMVLVNEKERIWKRRRTWEVELEANEAFTSVCVLLTIRTSPVRIHESSQEGPNAQTLLAKNSCAFSVHRRSWSRIPKHSSSDCLCPPDYQTMGHEKDQTEAECFACLQLWWELAHNGDWQRGRHTESDTWEENRAEKKETKDRRNGWEVWMKKEREREAERERREEKIREKRCSTHSSCQKKKKPKEEETKKHRKMRKNEKREKKEGDTWAFTDRIREREWHSRADRHIESQTWACIHSARTRFGDGDGLLLHCFMNGDLVTNIHFVELIDATNALKEEREERKKEKEKQEKEENKMKRRRTAQDGVSVAKQEYDLRIFIQSHWRISSWSLDNEVLWRNKQRNLNKTSKRRAAVWRERSNQSVRGKKDHPDKTWRATKKAGKWRARLRELGSSLFDVGGLERHRLLATPLFLVQANLGPHFFLKFGQGMCKSEMKWGNGCGLASAWMRMSGKSDFHLADCKLGLIRRVERNETKRQRSGRWETVCNSFSFPPTREFFMTAAPISSLILHLSSVGATGKKKKKSTDIIRQQESFSFNSELLPFLGPLPQSLHPLERRKTRKRRRKGEEEGNNPADIISEHERSSFDSELPGLWVLHHRGSQTSRGTRFATRIDRSRNKMRYISEETKKRIKK